MDAVEFVIDPDLPVFEGHFPGNPVVPGVMLLDMIMQQLDVASLPVAKFLKPVRPGDVLRVEYEGQGDTLRFKGTVDDALVISGTLKLNDERAA